MLLVFLIGFLLGFLGSVPIAGPIAALVLRRGLEGRFAAGLHIALGGSVAEGIYAYFAFWGLGELLSGSPWIESVSRLAGAALLMALGLLFVLRPPRAGTSSGISEAPVGLKRNLALGFTITALNPTLIATWGAAVTMGYSVLPIEFAPGHALPFSAGASTGIAVWFAILLTLLNRFKGLFQPQTWTRIARATGVLLLVLGASAALRFGMQLLQQH